MGKGGQKGKGERYERLERDPDLERRFNAPASATSHNVNAFFYACRYISGRSLNLGKTTCHSFQLLKRLEDFSPGFSGIILSFYTMTYH